MVGVGRISYLHADLFRFNHHLSFIFLIWIHPGLIEFSTRDTVPEDFATLITSLFLVILILLLLNNKPKC